MLGAALTEPLLARDYQVTPFEDATPLLDFPDALRARAESLGTLFLPGFLPAEVVGAVRGFVRRLSDEHGWTQPDASNPPTVKGMPGAKLNGRGWDDPHWVDLQTALRLSPEFDALAEHPRLHFVLETLLGEPAACATANYAWLKLPGSPEHTTRAHQDLYYLPKSTRMWTVWVPMVDTPEDLGPLGVVPHSRDLGLLRHASPFIGIEDTRGLDWHSQAVQCGDLVIFDALAIHCAWSNVSATDVRLSADIRYEPTSLGGETGLRAVV